MTRTIRPPVLETTQQKTTRASRYTNRPAAVGFSRLTQFLLLLFAVILLNTLLVPDAEARRFGGGMNFGKTYRYARPAQPARPFRQPSRANNDRSNTTGAAPRRGGLMGPLAGLAAGGLLGALFFGGAFQGIQLVDVLVFGLLAFLGFRLLRGLTRSGPARQPGEPITTGPPNFRTTSTVGTGHSPERSFETPTIGSALNDQPLTAAPSWFDEARFMAEAEHHFRRLQAAWDDNDLTCIQEYVTPELFEEIRHQSLQRESASTTEVIQLSSQLLDVIEDGDQVVAAILFSGKIREDGGTVQPFAEIWHITHRKDNPAGDWRIAGIRQHES